MQRTKSIWGSPPSRIYKFLSFCILNIGMSAKICVIGCSDGKFVFPFLRRGFNVTGFEIDKTAIYGGNKIGPMPNIEVPSISYVPHSQKQIFDIVQSQVYSIPGILKRAQIEELYKNLTIIEEDFYHTHRHYTFDVVITSCSMQYKQNRDLTLSQALERITSVVSPKGYLYMDYMLPLEDRHIWKSPLFPRSGEIKAYFSSGWSLIHNREMKYPKFEKPHIDRLAPHFHRFGYLLARRIE